MTSDQMRWDARSRRARRYLTILVRARHFHLYGTILSDMQYLDGGNDDVQTMVETYFKRKDERQGLG